MKHLLTVVVSLASALLWAQPEQKPLMRIGDQTIMLDEFEAGYQKNRKAAAVEISRREYLDLFVRYKLKVAEARAMGLDTLRSFVEEQKYYIGQLIKPYLVDSVAIRAMRQQEMQRMKMEVDASHILVSVRPNAKPADTLAAYRKIESLRQRVMDGEDFGEVAMAESDDRSAKTSKGRLQLFSALQMVEPFEEAAFSTPIGQTSGIFRTRFGYHIVHVFDRRPKGSEVRVAHIMKMTRQNPDQNAARRAKADIDSLYALLKNGADFGQMAITASDDKQSAQQGGVMPWFCRSAIVSEFSEAAFALDSIGQMSEPVESPFGWHIIKLLGRRAETPAEELEPVLDRAAQSGHSLGTIGRVSLARRLMREYAWQWDKEQVRTLMDIVTSAERDSVKDAQVKAMSAPVATYSGGELRFDSYKQISRRYRRDRTEAENLESIAADVILEYEKTQLTAKYPELRYLEQEYTDGLLIFEVSQRTVWSDAVADSATVEAQYRNMPERYAQSAQFEGSIAFFDSPVDPKILAQSTDKRSPRLLKKAARVVSGAWEQGSAFDDYIWPLVPSRYVVPVGHTVVGDPLPLDKVRGRVVSDCQQMAEQRWVDELMAKYKPQILLEIK